MTGVKQRDSNGSLRILRFLQRTLREQAQSFWLRAAALSRAWPVRLPFGALWVPRNDNLGEPLLTGSFETAEISFVECFLKPGLTVLDLGAHHGLYTLLASKRVGRKGKVYAFEPSPRERRALRLHVVLNRCWNVSVLRVSLGSENTQADLFVAQGSQTGCNSLRPPIVQSSTVQVHIQVIRLVGCAS